MTPAASRADPSAELRELRDRLAEAEQVLHAIRNGNVDAVVGGGSRGGQVFTLAGADHAYRQLVETMSEGAATLSAGGAILYANACLASMLGRPLEQVPGSDLRSHLAADGARALDALLAAALLAPARTELELLAADGRRVPVYLALSCLRGEREPLYCLVLTDLTQQQHHEHIARLAAMVEGSGDAIIGTTLDGLITDWNDAAMRLYGYRRDEVLGRPMAMLVPPEGSGQVAVEQRMRRLAVGEAVRDEEGVSLRKDGSRFDSRISMSHIRGADRVPCGVVARLQDIGECKRSQALAQRANRALKARGACSAALIRAHGGDETALLDEVCRIVVETAGYRGAWVGFAAHDAPKTVAPVATAGHAAAAHDAAAFSWGDGASGQGPAGRAIRTLAPQVVRDALGDPRYAPWRDDALRHGYRSVLALPLASAGTVLGALCIHADDGDSFDTEEVELLGQLAGELAFGVVALRTRAEHAAADERLRRSMESTVAALSGTLDKRDAYTAGHQRRVAELAAAIAGALGCSDDEIHGIRLAGMVHDLGKILAPAEILAKPAPLTRLEYELVKTHAHAGYELLKDIDFPWPIAELVYQHHERCDGSGYPRGLCGGQILPGARILAVADTVEAMCSHRPYRAARGIEAALAEIAAQRGARYDAAVVDACTALFGRGGFTFSA